MSSGVPTGAGNPPPPTTPPPNTPPPNRAPGPGRPKGSQNKPRMLQELLEATPEEFKRFVEDPSGEPIGNNQGQERRPGRPQGSKSKKIAFRIPEGSNIVQGLLELCCRHRVSVTVLDASGQLANIIPCSQPDFNIRGPLPIVSLYGTVVPTLPPLSVAQTWQEAIFAVVVSLRSWDNAVCSGGIAVRTATAANTVEVTVMIKTMHEHDVLTRLDPLSYCFDGLIVKDEDAMEVNDQTNTSNIETTPARDVPRHTWNLSVP